MEFIKPAHKTPLRRLEVAFMRLERRNAFKMFIWTFGLLAMVTGVIIGIGALMLIGYIRVTFL